MTMLLRWLLLRESWWMGDEDSGVLAVAEEKERGEDEEDGNDEDGEAFGVFFRLKVEREEGENERRNEGV